MQAVVMAGGQGTRLRPLTSNQPKPMVPIVNKPTALHILELLSRHGIDDVVMTLAFLPQVIRNYFGDGSDLGMRIHYSVEDSPLGTAGSVKHAQESLDETFLVISGDALTDFDLSRIIAFHREREAMVTIALKTVDNPLEFGVVIVDEEGRIERFLEKPGWGQVFSDTINTGIYVLEPEVLDHVPAGTPYDFSHELFPKLFEMHKPLYGMLCEGYWQDIGGVDQYLQANKDALDGKVRLRMPGVRLRGNVWVGEGVNLDSLANVEGPALIGNYAKIDLSATIGAHTVLGNNIVMRAGSHVANAVVGENSYLGPGSRVRGAVLGNSVDVRTNAVIAEGAVVGDQCSVGENSLVGNHVKIYPFKTIEPGSSIRSSIIWETRGMSSLFGANGVRGLINVDITAEMVLRLAMSYGTLLHKGVSVSTSRDAHPASRVLKRAVIAGLNATGISVRDLRMAPLALNRFDLKTGEAAGGIHVRIAPDNPEEVEILFAEPPGIPISGKTERSIENYFFREDFRRALPDEMGTVSFPPRLVETYASALLQNWDVERIVERRFRVVLDYARSPVFGILSPLLDRLAVEAVTVNAHAPADTSSPNRRADGGAGEERVRRLVRAVEADLAVIFDASAESLTVLDEEGRRVADTALLLLLMRHVCITEGPGIVALPVCVTRHAEEVARACGADVMRTKIAPAALLAEAAQPHVIFAAGAGGRYIFPRFLPSADAALGLGKVLELLAAAGMPLSQLVTEVPPAHVLHEVVPCPWHIKGAVMRRMVEELKHERLSLFDGIEITLGAGEWVQLVPDADAPLFHIYAEADDASAAQELLRSYREHLRRVIEEEKEKGPRVA
ncbi:MAG: sugar phosphate nucleotidyltransferase [Actinobacteria bacterium]|nr:sugar phosphate nucleotidyltransferase [Actinomycetota bacterium]